MELSEGNISRFQHLKDFLHRGDPVSKYISRVRYGQEKLHEGESVLIPIGRFEQIKYTKNGWGWTTNRDMSQYNIMLFSDQYDEEYQPSADVAYISKLREDTSEVIAGGIEMAFGGGRVVLDLGSGEAVGLLEYSRKFPKTVFIGIDEGYDKQIKLNLKKMGVQLTKDNWEALSSVPDNSVDTILSNNGALTWGRNDRTLAAITRVAKPGAIVRCEMSIHSKIRSDRERGYEAMDLLKKIGWNIIPAPDSLVAIKTG